MNKYIGSILLLLVIIAILITLMSIVCYMTFENYVKLRKLGMFPILSYIMKKRIKKNNHKYDSHRYKQRRRYNHSGQARRYN